MPRIARIVVPGYPHHITQRGNYKQDAFVESADYIRYLKCLEKYSREYGLSILAYCLILNHVHFAAIPENEHSLSKTFSVCHTLYSQYFNKKNEKTGHLWQGRFYSCVLDEKHLYATIRYIENNPVRAKLVEKAEDWEWSSARAHLNKGKSILSLARIDKFMDMHDWKGYLQDEDEIMSGVIKANTLSGKPVGNSVFISKLEQIIGKQIK